MSYRWIATIALALLAGQIISQEQLTLNQAVRLALEHNGDLIASRLNTEAARARTDGAKSQYFPTVSPNYRYQTFATRANGQTTSGDSRVFDVSADWLALDTGQRNLSYQQARTSLSSSVEAQRLATKQLIFLTIRAYYDVTRRKELLRVAQASVERSQRLYDLAKFQADPAIGTAPQKDVLQAEADLANSQVQVIGAQNSFETSTTELKRLIGWDLRKPLPELEPTPEIQPVADKPSLEQLWQVALRDRPDIRQEALSLQLQRLGLQSAKLRLLPSLQVVASGVSRIDPNRSDTGQISVAASYPLFDAGLTRANHREAQASYDAARYRYEQSERDAQAEVEQTLLNYTESERRAEASKKAVAAAQKNYEAARDSLAEGAGTVIEVLTAQVLLVTAETSFIQAVYDFYVAELQLRLAIGADLPEEKQ